MHLISAFYSQIPLDSYDKIEFLYDKIHEIDSHIFDKDDPKGKDGEKQHIEWGIDMASEHGESRVTVMTIDLSRVRQDRIGQTFCLLLLLLLLARVNESGI